MRTTYVCIDVECDRGVKCKAFDTEPLAERGNGHGVVEHAVGATRSEAREELHHHGWRRRKRKDWCPYCIAHARGRKMLAALKPIKLIDT
jgi:hypothetical protein